MLTRQIASTAHLWNMLSENSHSSRRRSDWPPTISAPVLRSCCCIWLASGKSSYATDVVSGHPLHLLSHLPSIGHPLHLLSHLPSIGHPLHLLSHLHSIDSRRLDGHHWRPGFYRDHGDHARRDSFPVNAHPDSRWPLPTWGHRRIPPMPLVVPAYDVAGFAERRRVPRWIHLRRRPTQSVSQNSEGDDRFSIRPRYEQDGAAGWSAPGDEAQRPRQFPLHRRSDRHHRRPGRHRPDCPMLLPQLQACGLCHVAHVHHVGSGLVCVVSLLRP